MDIKNYISSGVLEAYVLNTATAQERQEVECMSHIYPEIKAELTTIQSSIEKMAIKNSVDPPEKLRTSIMELIKKEKQWSDSTDDKIISFKDNNRDIKGNSIYKLLAAACLIGIIAVGAYVISLQSDVQDLIVENVKESQKLEEANTALHALHLDVKLTEEQLAFLTHKNTQKVKMSGTENHPQLFANVYWNTLNKKVVIDIENLPTPPLDKQYQLWAIVDGLPVDMGLLAPNATSTELYDMNQTGSAQAFAVTLEPKGGSVGPTMEEMYVVGGV